MELDQVDLYGLASRWAVDKVDQASSMLDVRTPCDGWDVRTLMNHMLDTQRFFTRRARGEEASPPAADPPDLIGDTPVATFERARADALAAFEGPGDAEARSMSVGVAFSDMLLHGWDLAEATTQDSTMPDGLAEAAYTNIFGKFTDEQRQGLFKPQIPVGAEATAQQRLLAYTGRNPTD
jgi:uncharacterized protein (TIGR03086 family)